MYSLQEIIAKTGEQCKAVQRHIDETGGYSFDTSNIYMGQKRSVERELRESIRRIPLSHMIREYLIDGLAGADSLIQTKLADVLYMAAHKHDLADLVSVEIINGWEGGDLTVDIVDRYGMRAQRGGSGGSGGSRTPETVQATLSPKLISMPLVAESSMIEDAQVSLVEWYAREAAMALVGMSNDLLIEVMKAPTDGVGTTTDTATGDADETKYTGGAATDILQGWAHVGDHQHVAQTMITTPESWENSISQSTTATTMDSVAPVQMDPRFDVKLSNLNLDVVFNTSDLLHDEADLRDAAFTECYTLIFDRDIAVLTGRKRWLLIENYVDPVADLEGAVVSCRQDSVTLYDDAIYVMHET
jgi:hypothetical protein